MFSPEMVSLSGEKQVMLTTQIVQLMEKKIEGGSVAVAGDAAGSASVV